MPQEVWVLETSVSRAALAQALSATATRDKLASSEVCAAAPSIRGSMVQVCSASLQPHKAALYENLCITSLSDTL